VEQIKERMEQERKIRLETLKRKKAQQRRKKQLRLMEEKERSRRLRERKLRMKEASSHIKTAADDKLSLPAPDETQSHIISRPLPSVSGRTILSEQFETLSFADSAAQFREEAMRLRDICKLLEGQELHDFPVSPVVIDPLPEAKNQNSIDDQEKDLHPETDSLGADEEDEFRVEDEKVDTLSNQREQKYLSKENDLKQPPSHSQMVQQKNENPSIRQENNSQRSSHAVGRVRLKSNQRPPRRPRWGGGNENEEQKQRRMAFERRKLYAQVCLPKVQEQLVQQRQLQPRQQEMYETKKRGESPPKRLAKHEAKPHSRPSQQYHHHQQQGNLNYTLAEAELKESLQKLTVALHEKKRKLWSEPQEILPPPAKISAPKTPKRVVTEQQAPLTIITSASNHVQKTEELTSRGTRRPAPAHNARQRVANVGRTNCANLPLSESNGGTIKIHNSDMLHF